MPTKECCRTCHHCLSYQSVSGGLCRLRKIKVHPDIAPIAVCHHWTKKAPSLPKFEDTGKDLCIDKQLELGRAIACIET